MSLDSVLDNTIQNLEQGIYYALGQQAPSLKDFENASQAAYSPGNAGAYGLRELLDSNGHAVTINTASGVSAAAFVDGRGNLIVSYQGTVTDIQQALDVAILARTPPSQVQGLQDALSFYKQAVDIAHSQALSQLQTYVTGFSLGGTLASYVASQTGAAGASFASSGVPGYSAGGTPAANFVSYAEQGDPFAQYATDGVEKALASLGGDMDHYGSIVSLGSESDAVPLEHMVNQLPLAVVGSLMSHQSSLTSLVVQYLEGSLSQQMAVYHNMDLYSSAANAAGLPGSASGLQNTSLDTIMHSVVNDLPTLANELPKLLNAGSVQAAETVFQADLPDLANELVQLTHAPSFNAAVDKMFTAFPSLAADLGNPAKLSSKVIGLVQNIIQAYAPEAAPVVNAYVASLASAGSMSTVAAAGLHHDI